MTVRSKQLATGLITGASVITAYTVPANHTTIVRTVSAFNTDNVFNRLYVEPWHGGSQLTTVSIPLDAFGTLGESEHAELWLVLMAGDVLKLDALHASIYYAISGAELLGVPP